MSVTRSAEVGDQIGDHYEVPNRKRPLTPAKGQPHHDHPHEPEALALLQQWLACYRNKDVDGILALVSGDDVVVVGTGVDEVCFGLAALHAPMQRDFSQADALDMTLSRVRAAAGGDAAAFVYCDAVVTGSAGGAAFEVSGLRFTAGLERTAQGWRFAQMHLSAPDAAQSEDSSF